MSFSIRIFGPAQNILGPVKEQGIRKKTKSAFLPHESPNHVHPEEQINVFEYSGQRLEPIQGPLWFLHKRFHAIHFLWQLAMAIFQV